MRITFAEILSPGLAVVLDGQRFDLIDIAPHTRRDGTETQLLVWMAECPTCGVPFKCTLPTLSMPETRRCIEHRQPGKKVIAA